MKLMPIKNFILDIKKGQKAKNKVKPMLSKTFHKAI
jgi:hypothetical protein